MKTIIVLIMLLSLNIHAGNEKGNGGDAIVCRNSKGNIVKSELLDYYEGRSYRQMAHTFEAQMSHREFFEKLAAKLIDFDADRFTGFKEEALKLLKSMEEYRSGAPQSLPGYVYSSGSLPDIADSAHLIMPKGCAVEQLVIQVAQAYPEDPKFIIQSEILESLSENDFRGIILHEVLYKHFITAFWVTDSVTTRYFHQVVTFDSLDSFNFMDYVQLLKEIFPVVPLWLSKQTLKRHDRYMYVMSLEKIENDFYKMDATGARYVFTKDGEIDKQKTLDTGHGFLLFSDEIKNAKDCRRDRPKITVTDSRGKTEEWRTWRLWRVGKGEIRDVPFGKLKIKLEIPASKDRACKNALVEVNDGREVLLTYKLLPIAQTLEFNFNVELDEELYPKITK